MTRSAVREYPQMEAPWCWAWLSLMRCGWS